MIVILNNYLDEDCVFTYLITYLSTYLCYHIIIYCVVFLYLIVAINLYWAHAVMTLFVSWSNIKQYCSLCYVVTQYWGKQWFGRPDNRLLIAYY